MRIDVPAQILAPRDLGRVHLIGIGGAGLSGIARLMAAQGVPVSGSDANSSPVVDALRHEGIDARVGHDRAHLDGVDTVIASTAVHEDNPEIVEALGRGLRLWPRSAAMASLMIGRRTLAIAGTHGKTTTTAMLTCALRADSADPSFAIGAEVEALGTNAALGASDLFVVESDESDGAFLEYHPAAAVITNVDPDHLDVWGTEAAYHDAFRRFVDTVGECVVLGVDDAGAAALVPIVRAAGLQCVTVGTEGSGPGADADLVIEQLATDRHGTSYVARWRDGLQIPVALAVVGEHYAVDSALALGLGRWLGRDVESLAAGLGAYRGARRRMEFIGEAGGIEFFDSYAHHPTEIRADLQAARAVADGRRLVVAYQPHLVSRTRRHGQDMGRALSSADRVLVADIYLAREPADPDVTAELVVRAVQGPPATAAGSLDALTDMLLDEIRPGDVVCTLGAGDITTVGPRLLDQVRGLGR